MWLAAKKLRTDGLGPRQALSDHCRLTYGANSSAFLTFANPKNFEQLQSLLAAWNQANDTQAGVGYDIRVPGMFASATARMLTDMTKEQHDRNLTPGKLKPGGDLVVSLRKKWNDHFKPAGSDPNSFPTLTAPLPESIYAEMHQAYTSHPNTVMVLGWVR